MFHNITSFTVYVIKLLQPYWAKKETSLNMKNLTNPKFQRVVCALNKMLNIKDKCYIYSFNLCI